MLSWGDSATERVPMGAEMHGCGWPVAYLDDDDPATPYENRQHWRNGVRHLWPQVHTCEPGPDACQICDGCVDC